MNDRTEGLGLLLADVLASDESERQTLVRYADDPAALSESDRVAFEARLAEDAGLRDRLAVLRDFDPRGAESALVDDDDGVVTPMVARRRTNWVPWVGVAAAAGLATLAMLPLLGDGTATDDAQTERPMEIVEAPAPSATPELSEIVEIAESDVPPPPVVEEIEIPAPVEVAVEPMAPPAAEEIVEVEEVLLAAHFEPVSYRAPADFLARVAPDATVRGSASGPALTAWVPDHVAHTSTPQPTLYWSLSGELPQGHEVGLVVTAESASEPLYEGSQPVDAELAWQHTDLASLGITLESGEVYRWSVFLRTAGGDALADRIAQGWIEYRAPSGDHEAALSEAKIGSRAARFAEHGYWYDALALLVGFAADHPEDRDARERLEGFLATAGIASPGR